MLPVAMGKVSPFQALLAWPTGHCCLLLLLGLPLPSLVAEVQVSDPKYGAVFFCFSVEKSTKQLSQG